MSRKNRARCQRCGKSEREANTPISGGICGNCADDLRDEAKADAMDPRE